ncbi:MAG: hypothetical protein V7L27_13040 [Nostoc sp.]|uniref:hypothetical protein n=1 Tax=Nostoc sp. TaxID=1180 RepID=UPI002FF502CB
MNRRQDKRLIIVETAIYRVFVMIYRIFSDLEFSSKNLSEPYCKSYYLWIIIGV